MVQADASLNRSAYGELSNFGALELLSCSGNECLSRHVKVAYRSRSEHHFFQDGGDCIPDMKTLSGGCIFRLGCATRYIVMPCREEEWFE